MANALLSDAGIRAAHARDVAAALREAATRMPTRTKDDKAAVAITLQAATLHETAATVLSGT